MHWSTRYEPPDLTHWQGRPDLPKAACFFQIVQALNLMKPIDKLNQPNNFALLGFCCDEGIRRNHGRLGAFDGPISLRQQLAKLSFNRREAAFYDAGDITCMDENLEEAQLALAQAVSSLLEAGITPILIGGGHEIAYGNYLGIRQYRHNQTLGIINFDAHFDMRPLLAHQHGSSGTSFLQMAESSEQQHLPFNYAVFGIQRASNISAFIETAHQWETSIVYADEIGDTSKKMHHVIQQMMDDNQHLYLSICLDVFAACYAPGVSAPQAGGLTPWQIIPSIRECAASGKVLSYDIAELSPKWDHDVHTAKLAALLVYEIIHHHAKGTYV